MKTYTDAAYELMQKYTEDELRDQLQDLEDSLQVHKLYGYPTAYLDFRIEITTMALQEIAA